MANRNAFFETYMPMPQVNNYFIPTRKKSTQFFHLQLYILNLTHMIVPEAVHA